MPATFEAHFSKGCRPRLDSKKSLSFICHVITLTCNCRMIVQRVQICKIGIQGYRGDPAPKCCSPIFLLSKIGSYVSQLWPYFLQCAIFSIFSNTVFKKVLVKQKVSIIETYDPILERRKIGLQHKYKETYLFQPFSAEVAGLHFIKWLHQTI